MKLTLSMLLVTCFSQVMRAQGQRMITGDSLALHQLDVFDGVWVVLGGADTERHPDTLCRTSCQWSSSGRCLVCGQLVFNGKDTSRDICIYSYDPGKKKYRFYIMYESDEKAAFENLKIDGNTWEYYGQSEHASKTRFFRTMNFFNEKKDEVLFEAQYSEDEGRTWITTKRGRSKKLGGGEPVRTRAAVQKDPPLSQRTDSFKIRGTVSLTGLVQTGDENRTVASLLSEITGGTRLYEIEPLTSIAYSTKPGTRVEGEYLENVIVRYHQENRFYSAVGLSFEKSLLRKIDYRWSAGATLVCNILEQKDQVIKLGIGYSHEFTQYARNAFNPPYIPGDNHYSRNLDQVYIRLKGRNAVLRNRIIFSYDMFIQPAIKNINDYRWTLINNLDLPLTRTVSVRASAVSSFEQFVATNVSKYNFRLTYGVNISF